MATPEEIAAKREEIKAQHEAKYSHRSPRDRDEDDWRTTLGVAYPVVEGEESLTDLDVWDFARLLANTPGSLARNIGLIGEMALNPLDTASGIGKVALSGLHAGARAVLGDSIGSEADEEVFWSVMNELKKRYGTELRKTIVEDPMGLLTDLAGGAMSAGKLATRFGGTAARVGQKVASAGAKANKFTPPSVLGGALKGAAKGVSSMAQAGIPEIASLTTGIDPTALRGMVSATADPKSIMRGGNKVTSRQAAVNTMRKKLFDEGSGEWQLAEGADIAFHIQEELKRAKNIVADRKFDDAIRPYRKLPMDDFDGTKKSMLAFLEKEWGMKPRKTNDNAFSRASTMSEDFPRGVVQFDPIEGMVRSKLGKAQIMSIAKAFTRYEDQGRWGHPTTLGEVHDAMQFIDNKVMPTSKKFKGAQSAIGELRRKAEDGFPKKAKDVMESYRVETTLLEDFDMMLQDAPMRKGSFKDAAATMNHFNEAMREGITPELKRRFLEIAEKRGDAFFNGPAAGNALREWMPVGIHARNIALSTLGTSGILGILGFGAPAFLPILAFPFTQPRLIGEMMSLLGGGVKIGNATQKWIDDLHIKASRVLPREAVASVPIGVAIERLLEAGVEVPLPPEELQEAMKRPAPRKKSPSQILGGGFAG